MNQGRYAVGMRCARAGWLARTALRTALARAARTAARGALAVAALASLTSALSAQDYPSRAVKIIVPFPAGGTADALPRLVADWLSRKWGQPVVIENRTGAAGNIGAEAAFKADPDGYTLLSAPPPPLVINHNLYPKLAYDPTEFVPIVIISRVPNALVVNPKVKADTLADFIAAARANPAKITSANQGNGSTSHLTAELFQMMADVKFQHVPYRLGAGPAGSVGGNVEIMFDNLGVSLPLVKAGQLKLWRWRPPAHGLAATCRRSPRRCPVSKPRHGTAWWRRRRRRAPSSTRSTPTSTRRSKP